MTTLRNYIYFVCLLELQIKPRAHASCIPVTFPHIAQVGLKCVYEVGFEFLSLFLSLMLGLQLCITTSGFHSAGLILNYTPAPHRPFYFFFNFFRFVYSMCMTVCTYCAYHIYIWCLTISKQASYALEVGGTDCCEPLLGAVN